MAAHTAVADLWDGAQGPQIKPVRVPKTWHNDRDRSRRRATFGVLYPLLEVAIDTSDDRLAKFPARFEATKRRSVPGVRLVLTGPKSDSFPIRISASATFTGERPWASQRSWDQHLRIVFFVVVCSEESSLIKSRSRVVRLIDAISGDPNSMSASSLTAYSRSALRKTRASSQRKLIQRLFSKECLLQSTTAKILFLTVNRMLPSSRQIGRRSGENSPLNSSDRILTFTIALTPTAGSLS